MYESYSNLKYLLLGLQFLSALVGMIYLKKINHTYWKWFAIYLVIIFVQELIWKNSNFVFTIKKQQYYTYFGIPIQYLFFYWLYAYKSLGNKKIFFICLFIYLLSFIPIEISGLKVRIYYSVSLNMGNILLMLLVVLEFLKQIKNDNILEFKNSKMFYINIGVIFFYIGTFPFLAFYHQLLEQVDLWNAYFLYFLISNCIMYSLFTISFICGKHQS